MQTIFIWDTLLEYPVRFFCLDGDYTHLDRVYINAASGDDAKIDELDSLVYDEDGEYRVEMLDEWPVLNDYKVVVVGFLP